MKQRRLILILFSVVILLAFSGEADFHTEIQEKLNGYYYRNMPVKLNFFFNQSQYVPGDTAFYRVAFFTAQDHEPVSKRQIINVVLTDNKGIKILEQKVLAENGWGKNQLILPANLMPGAYTVVGYSEWMRNHDKRLFSYSRLLVTKTKQLAAEEQPSLGFYPEGGSLSVGVNNKVVALGKPGGVVTVTNSNGQAITTCTIDKNGMGLFYLTPTENEHYSGALNQEKVMLPEPSTLGLSMVLTPPVVGKPLKIAFEKTESTQDESFYLTIVSQRRVYYSAKVSFGRKHNALISVPYENLLPGLSLVTLFRADGTALLNRIVFIRDFDQAIVNTDLTSTTFSPREKVTVNIQITDSKGQPVQGKFSVSVLDSLISNEKNQTMVRALSLSDLPFSGIQQPSIKGMDDYSFNNFLITQEWLRFAWPDVMSGKTRDQYPLRSSLQMSGKLIHPEGKLFGDSTVVTFYLQRDVMVYQSFVLPDGKFDFSILFDFLDYDEVYYRVETRKQEIKGVTLIQESTAVQPFALPSWTETSESSRYGTFARDRAVVESAYKPIRGLQSYTFHSRSVLDDIREGYFIADREVKLSDYMLFPNMEETLREVVPFVNHRMANGRHTVHVFLFDEKTMSTRNPVFIIDGVMTDDVDYFMSLKPEDVDVIKVLSTKKNRDKFGPIGRNGVVIVETKIPDNAKNVVRSKTMFYATGVSQPMPYFNITEKNFQSRVPVIKSCLYWNPVITTDAQGKATFSFYTADNTGNFKIIMDGLTSDGEPLSATQNFKVKFSPVN